MNAKQAALTTLFEEFSAKMPDNDALGIEGANLVAAKLGGTVDEIKKNFSAFVFETEKTIYQIYFVVGQYIACWMRSIFQSPSRENRGPVRRSRVSSGAYSNSATIHSMRTKSLMVNQISLCLPKITSVHTLRIALSLQRKERFGSVGVRS